MTMEGAAMRPWCARIRYPGKSPILFGTTTVRHDAPLHEVQAALVADIDDCLPGGWEILSLLPGAIVFVPEE